MSVSLRVGPRVFEVGAESFLHCFFSTVAVRLEGSRWASRFPRLLGDLYEGSLAAEFTQQALDELKARMKGTK